jgi:hypothetical protein
VAHACWRSISSRWWGPSRSRVAASSAASISTRRAASAVGLDHRRLAKADPLAADLDRHLGLGARELLFDGLGGLADIALDGEIEQHAGSPLVVALPRVVAVRGCPGVEVAERLHRVAGEKTGIARIDRLDLEAVLEPGVVAVVLAHQLLVEALGGPPVGVEVHAAAMLETWKPLPVQLGAAPAVATSST